MASKHLEARCCLRLCLLRHRPGESVESNGRRFLPPHTPQPKVELSRLAEKSVVSTIATKKGSTLIRLGARQRTEEEQQQIKSKCPEVHEYRLLAIARYKAPTTFPPSTTAVSLDPTRKDHPTRPEDGPRKKAPKIPQADRTKYWRHRNLYHQRDYNRF